MMLQGSGETKRDETIKEVVDLWRLWNTEKLEVTKN